MWNPVTLVANHNNVDPKALLEFAEENAKKYHIGTLVSPTGSKRLMVSNWYSEILVADFKKEEKAFEQLLNLFVPDNVGCEWDPKVMHA